MAFADNVWYCNFGNGSSTGYYAVTVRPQNTAVAAGVVRRQFTAPAVGSERCFVCIVAGTTANVTDATWVLTRGAKTTDGTVTWQECTGASAMNGDLTNTPNWTAQKAVSSPSLGSIIKRNNGVSYQICTTAGSMAASEPSFSDTAGVTTNDGTSVWTSLGPVGNFSAGGAPFTRLTAVCASTWFAAGNTIYVGDNHAESQTVTMVISPSTGTPVGKILCHNHSGSYPPAASDLMIGATISTGAANINISPGSGGAIYINGLMFKVGVGQSSLQSITLSTGNTFITCDACGFEIATTSTTSSLTVGSGSYGAAIFNNTTVKFASTSQKVSVSNGALLWQSTGQVLAAGSSIPTTFITPSLGVALTLEALDLSQLTAAIVDGSSANVTSLLKDCKLNASATFSVAGTATTLQFVRCDSGATAYKSTRYTLEGTESTETAITRVGGAVDAAGQAQSRKIVTTANAQWLRPFKAEPYAIWNPVTGSNVTVTVYGTINAGALPFNDDIWLEIEYLGSSAAPLGTMIATTKATLLSANAAVASDGSTWNGGGSGAGWLPFKLTATLSSPQPGLAGYLYARVRAAKVSTTFYIDPKIVLS